LSYHKIEKKNTDYQCDAVLCFLKERKNAVGEARGTWTLDIGLLKLKKPVLTQIQGPPNEIKIEPVKEPAPGELPVL
jgi:hypothetical protein